MIPAETERFWIDYIATERIRLRQESLGALDRFIDALLRLPPEVWHPWVRQLARRIVDEGEDIPVRMPLFRTVIFPALLADMQNSAPDAARLLAGFGQFLYKSPSCTDQLPQNRRSAFDLLASCPRRPERQPCKETPAEPDAFSVRLRSARASGRSAIWR
jgi:hypothetical protein